MTSERPGLPVATAAEAWALTRTLLRPHRRRAGLALLTLTAVSAVGLAAPLLIGAIVDRVAAGDGTGAIAAPAAALAGLAVVSTALSALGWSLIPAVGQPVLAGLRERVVDRALRTPAETVERAGRGDLLSRVSDDVGAVTEAVDDALPAVSGAVLTIVLSLVGLAALDLRLALAGLLAAPLQVVAVRWYVPRAGPAYARERAVSGARAEVVLEAVGGARTIRALGLGPAELPRVRTASLAGVDAVTRTMRIFTSFWTRLNLAELTGTAAVLVAGFLLVRDGAIGIGAATAAALLFVRLFDQFNMLLGSVDSAQRALAALRRLVGVALLEPPPAPPQAPAVARPAGVRARGIGHAYAGGPPVLHGVDLDLAPGERVALVGVSGAGKTTLAKVVAGVHAPTAGTVEVGGVPLPDLGRAVALVTQEVRVFAGPLADDLRLAAPAATDADLHAALAAAGATGWVAALPEGLATVVGEGGHPLTAAQAQQVALARLHLLDPAVAVLDEATAEAGSAGARGLEAAADRVLAGRTALVVAHRLTQAARADRVVVLDAGRVVEDGPHDALVAAGGPYARLWAAWSAGRQASSSSQSSPARSQ